MFLVLKLITFQTFHWFNYSTIRSSDKYAWFCWLLTKDLIKKKLATNSLSDKKTKSLYRDYYLHRNVNFCGMVLKISTVTKENISNNPKCRKSILKFIWNTRITDIEIFFSELWHLFSQVSIDDCLVPLCVISGTFLYL